MLIKLTLSQNGETTLLNTDLIDSVEANRSGVGSMINLSNGKFRFVSESVDQIYALLGYPSKRNSHED